MNQDKKKNGAEPGNDDIGQVSPTAEAREVNDYSGPVVFIGELMRRSEEKTK